MSTNPFATGLLSVYRGECGNCERAIETLIPNTAPTADSNVQHVRCSDCGNIASVRKGVGGDGE